ncbi:MAG: hypothetical protein GVY32_01490 [Gammaproteobacteria bacterium]|jgi:hypothetical protein|nr:hypothetical protein [Gammaproteobacteria bacterium]
MAPTQFVAGTGERSFRHDPRMRQALARLGRDLSPDGPTGTSLYWLLRSRRPKLAALTGRIPQADLLVVACALADCGGKLVVDAGEHGRVGSALAAAGMDWILRSGDCLPCLRRVRPFDCLIIGESADTLAGWADRLGRNALLLGLGRDPSATPRLADRILDTGLAGEIAQLRDGRRCLLIADHDPA